MSSDNGPVWYAQDIEKFGHRAAGPWNGMKGALTEAGHRMPFIARWPGKVQAGSSCGELICFTDMMATLASLVGEKLPNDAGEATNLFAQEPDKARELFAALKSDLARGRSR